MMLIAAWLALAAAPAGPPRLGVLIVIDQLGSGELEALALDGEADFGGLEARGAARFDAIYPYVGTETGPGHAPLSTPALPARPGTSANPRYVHGKAASSG